MLSFTEVYNGDRSSFTQNNILTGVPILIPGCPTRSSDARQGNQTVTHAEALLPVRLNIRLKVLQGAGEAPEGQVLPHQVIGALHRRRHPRCLTIGEKEGLQEKNKRRTSRGGGGHDGSILLK